MLGGTYCQWCEAYILKVKYFPVERVHQDRTQGFLEHLGFQCSLLMATWHCGYTNKFSRPTTKKKLLEGQPLIYNW